MPYLQPSDQSGKRPTTTPFAIFVYGTLKRGERNHDRYCQGVLEVREAKVRGRLYHLPFDYPALIVLEGCVRSVGTADYAADAGRSGVPADGTNRLSGPAVYGELMRFDDPRTRLPDLDGLEGFRPGERSYYSRVLVPVELSGEQAPLLAWAYAVGSVTEGVYLPGGRWSGDSPGVA